MVIDAKLRTEVEADITGRGDVTTTNMMGTTAYMVRGRMFAFWVADGLVAKLPDRTRQELLDHKAGAMFQGPQGRGFGEWTRLNLEKKEDVTSAIEGAKSAYDYVKGGAGPVRSKAKKKGKKG